MQYVNQPVAYHPQQAVQMPPQEGGGMSRLDSQPLLIGGHHMQMGGIPMQWPGGEMYYAPLVAYAGSGYGYPPISVTTVKTDVFQKN